MRVLRTITWLAGIFLLGTAACNIGVPAPLTDLQKQAATIVAMTLQAAATSGGPGAPLGTPAGSPTAGAGPAKFTVTENINCRTGPGTNYPLVITIPSGTTVQIVARYAGGNYFVLASPDGSGTCWVQADLGTPTGSYNTLPEVTPAAGSTDAPARPGSMFYSFDCSSGNLNTHLTWNDSANNETGYRVYRYDILAADLPANSTDYTESIPYTLGSTVTYSVEAYNSAGPSARNTKSFHCP
jgi:uncharacterized protein YraI